MTAYSPSETLVIADFAGMAPVSFVVDAGGNNVLESNEGLETLGPTWRNLSGGIVVSLTGTLSNYTGPAGPTYT